MQIGKESKIDPKSAIGSVIIGVRNLEETTEFYNQVIGLDLILSKTKRRILGVDENPLVILEHRPSGKSFPTSPGLFHLAILVPSRKVLGSWLTHFTKLGHRLDGVGDHIVSEALYLTDPEGNGIEIYRDRPREEWQFVDGRLIMDTLPVDLYSLLEDAEKEEFAGMPHGTKIGHIHLQVDDLGKAREFYNKLIGFDLVTELPSAVFLSAGGYHHHIGMNVWRSLGAEQKPSDALGLIAFQIMLPDQDALISHLSKIKEKGGGIYYLDGVPHLKDPAGNVIQFLSESGKTHSTL